MARAGLTPRVVVDVALDLVDERGADALTLAAVAKRAGVATPSLYKHIGGLADLRRMVATRVVEGLAQELNAAVLGLSGRDAVRALLRAYRSHVRSRPHRVRFLETAPTPDDPEASRAYRVAVDVMFAALRTYDLVEGERVRTTRLLRSMVHGFVVLEVAGGFGLPEDVDATFEELLDDAEALLDRRAPSTA
ncbi:hypothetical protein AQ490_06320 [Wenjunlia vitaminophila]|uniref:HTH tetR-type domain-containing protein n=1 Tax=Wenjunlia vitaminophila TaxID=76728 RepID=A0A0T6LN52_WENVI|nr:TetR/AcrR family transcriptional regulator [Wenjunlia vitaminophila]KRV47511.1 hypothetical protein AQ490_06320 [Wenjunlia vitaminophila]